MKQDLGTILHTLCDKQPEQQHGPFVYLVMDEFYDDESWSTTLHHVCFSPMLAEKYCAQAQACIAPEDKWQSNDDGSSSYSKDGQHWMFYIMREPLLIR
jgi:hypothetical protein